MEITSVDPWIEIKRNGGYSAEFAKAARIRAAERRREALEVQERERAIADLRSRCAPKWLVEIVVAVAGRHGVSVADIVFRRRRVTAVAARHEVFYLAKEGHGRVSAPKLAGWLNCDHTTVLYGMARHAARAGLPKLTKYNLEMAMKRRLESMRRFRSLPYVSIQHGREG